MPTADTIFCHREARVAIERADCLITRRTGRPVAPTRACGWRASM
jgi:hypothetical protein